MKKKLKKNQREVMISLKAVFDNQEETDTMELESVGTMEQEGDISRLVYEESDITGEDGVITTLEVQGDRQVTIRRAGPQKSQLFIEQGRRHLCQYGTEFGDITLGVCAERLKNELFGFGGSLFFQYSLDVNMELLSVNSIEIRVKERITS